MPLVTQHLRRRVEPRAAASSGAPRRIATSLARWAALLSLALLVGCGSGKKTDATGETKPGDGTTPAANAKGTETTPGGGTAKSTTPAGPLGFAAYVEPRSFAVLAFRPASLMKTGLADVKEVGEALSQAEREAKITPATFEEVAVIVPEPPSVGFPIPYVWGRLAAGKDVKTVLQSSFPEQMKWKEETHGGKKLFRVQPADRPKRAVPPGGFDDTPSKPAVKTPSKGEDEDEDEESVGQADPGFDDAPTKEGGPDDDVPPIVVAELAPGEFLGGLEGTVKRLLDMPPKSGAPTGVLPLRLADVGSNWQVLGVASFDSINHRKFLMGMADSPFARIDDEMRDKVETYLEQVVSAVLLVDPSGTEKLRATVRTREEKTAREFEDHVHGALGVLRLAYEGVRPDLERSAKDPALLAKVDRFVQTDGIVVERTGESLTVVLRLDGTVSDIADLGQKIARAASSNYVPPEMTGPPTHQLDDSGKYDSLGGDVYIDTTRPERPVVEVVASYPSLDALQTVSGFPELAALDLFPARNVDDITPLGGLKKLRKLELGYARLDDAGLQPLAGFSALESLGLEAVPVTAAGLEHLKGLKNLQALYLSATAIDDAAVPILAAMTGLKELDVTKTKLTQEGIAKLKAALPGAKISANPAPKAP